jgi:aspartate kinase
VKREVDAGHEVAVVVSAMAGKTNELVAWCRDAAPLHDAREYDAVVASGEQVTSGLLAIVLQSLGVPARSWQGWQIPVSTNDAHRSARITGISVDALKARLQAGEVAVVAGFQGLGPDNRISTLGRGGSDTSAVALAAALNADRCDIYTDVDGVYTTDPRIVPKAHRLDRISYEEMLEMASQGAKVLQTRSVELAMQKGVRVLVRSSFDAPDAPQTGDAEACGTLVCHEDEIVEQHVVSGIAYARDEAKVTLLKVADKPGVGMRSHAGVAAQMFSALAEKGINIEAISTSEIKISVLIDAAYAELAVRTLHSLFGLDKG